MDVEAKYIKETKNLQQMYAGIDVADKLGRVQLFFDARVLDSYVKEEPFRVIRTDTMGRVSRKGVWSVDFGICKAPAMLIHASAHAILLSLPESERGHWLDYMVTLPVSSNYIKGLTHSGCLDDGAIRDW